MIAYLIGAAVMAFGGIVELILGVRAEQQPLEDIATPLTAQEAEEAKEAEPSAADRGPDGAPPRPPGARARRHAALAPGPGKRLVLAVPAASGRDAPEWLDNEVGIIERALEEHGELGRGELAQRIGARYWGPGRFRNALREALAEGAARRAGRDRYGPSR